MLLAADIAYPESERYGNRRAVPVVHLNNDSPQVIITQQSGRHNPARAAPDPGGG